MERLVLSKLNFISILFIGFLDYVGISLVYPVFASMLFDATYPLVSLDASNAYRGAMLGILIGLTPLTQFFSAPLLGTLSDVKGRRTTLICGTFLGVLSYGLAVVGVWTHSITLLFLYRILIGICSSTLPVAQAMIADMSTPKQKARSFSLFSAATGLGFVAGPLLGGKLANPKMTSGNLHLSGYSIPFMAAGIMSLISLGIIIWKLPETGKISSVVSFNMSKSMNNIRKIFFWPSLRWFFTATFAFAFGWSCFNEFIPVLLKHMFDFSLSDIGNYYAYGGFWYAVCSGLITPTLLKHFSCEKILVKAVVGSGVFMFSFMFITEPQYIWYIMPLLILCISVTFPTVAALASNKGHTGNQGEILGVYQSVIGCGMGLSPIVMGSAIGTYPLLAAVGAAIFMLLAAAAFYQGIHEKVTEIESANV